MEYQEIIIIVVMWIFAICYSWLITVRGILRDRVTLSVFIGVLSTNLLLGYWIVVRSNDYTWLVYPYLYFGGFFLIIKLYQAQSTLMIRWPGWLLNELWVATVLFCVPPVLGMTIHLLLIGYDWFIPIVAYILTGAPMILFQDMLIANQKDNARLTREIINHHRKNGGQ